MFTEKELAYLKSQRLGRIATVSKDGQPDVAPVGYDFDGEHFYVGGRNVFKTLKFLNVQANPKVAFAVDDFEDANPHKPRGLKVHGTAELIDHNGYVGAGIYIRIKPETIWSWGIEAETIQGDKAVMSKRQAAGGLNDQTLLKF